MFSPNDVVRIKREVGKKASELDRIQGEILAKKKILSEIQSQIDYFSIEQKRQRESLLSGLIESVNSESRKLESARTERAFLEHESIKLRDILNLYKSSLREISEKKTDEKNTLLESLEKELTQKLETLVTQSETKEREIDNLTKAEGVTKKRLDSLTEKEKALLERVENLSSEKTQYLQEIVELKSQKQKLLEMFKKIERREKTSKIMLQRLSKKYLEHYKALPYKKGLEK